MHPDSIRTLSRRGAQLATRSPMAEYIVQHFTRADSPWHAEDNPNGYIPLCIAENGLLADLLQPEIEALSTRPPVKVFGYDAMVGAHEFRSQLAVFLERSFLGRRFAPEQIATLAGAGTILENLFYIIADPGDGVLVPTPSYAGFWSDLETRDSLQIIPVPCRSDDGFRLTPALLDAALASATVPVRALLFTNPDNPMGKVASAEELESVLAWAEAKGLHVVLDEIYALSVFGTTPFTSGARLRPQLGDRLHIVWAFSKDFGISGLRCGVLVSENEALVAAINGLAYWGAVSGHTQWLLGRMITNDTFVDSYIATLRTRLRRTYDEVTRALTRARIRFVEAEAGIFVLCDLRAFLPEQSWTAEAALWWRVLERANVNITPGSACRIAEPGFARICYAAEALPTVLEGIKRMGVVLSNPEGHPDLAGA